MNDDPSELEAPPRAREAPGGSPGESPELDRPKLTPEWPSAPPPAPRRRWRSALGFLLVLALFGAIVWLALERGKTPNVSRFASAPVPVAVAPVVKGDMPVRLGALGTVTPLATVTVRTRLSGQLTAVAFKEGQLVKKDAFLAQIDPRPYQVALEQAKAQLGKDRAALANARVDLRRYDRLVAQNSIARQTRDTQSALVAQDEATIKADEAQIDAQRLNLTYAHVTSPISGRVGLRQVDPGNYVTPSDPNGIVVVTQMEPISVLFALPENDLPVLLKRLRSGPKPPVTAFDSNGKKELAEGRLETLDNQIDPTTGTIKLRAIFANAEGVLFPNQFVTVRLLVDTLRGAVIVPVSAIERGAPGTFVYVVGKDGKAAIRKITLGPSTEERAAVLSGLSPGERIVIDGADRLKPDAKVRVVPPTPQGGPSQ